MKKKSWLKKLSCAAMACTLVLVCLAGCGGTDVEATTSPDGAQTIAPSADPDETEELTAVELVKRMGNGINLGNTMEAYGHLDLGIKAEVSEYETHWGQPVTTQEMLDGMKAAGFDSIRVPIAWTNVMDFENGDYTIRADFMDRIEEIVSYALNADMYVIINDHWDGSWWGCSARKLPRPATRPWRCMPPCGSRSQHGSKTAPIM